MSLPYNKDLIPKAKELRKNMTPQERRLWYVYLRKYPLRFQRQKTIRGYIADFFCDKARLIIELDGSQHYTEEGLAHDGAREELLRELGVAVLRFTNEEIEYSFQEVCKEIDRAVKERVDAVAMIKEAQREFHPPKK